MSRPPISESDYRDFTAVLPDQSTERRDIEDALLYSLGHGSVQRYTDWSHIGADDAKPAFRYHRASGSPHWLEVHRDHGVPSVADFREYLFQATRNELTAPRMRVIFTSRRLNGWMPLGESLRLRRVPPGCPVPEDLQGPHPCLLEFVTPSSVVFGIDNRRVRRVFRPLTWLLSVFLRSRVGIPTHRRVFAQPLIEGTVGTCLCEEQYWHESLANLRLFEPLPAEERIGSRPLDELFGSLWVPEGGLVPPDRIEELFRRYGALSESSRAQYLRACWWHWQALEVHDHSRTLSYLALIYAIEALAHHDNRTFKPFLEHHLPSSIDWKATVLGMYQLRNQLVHRGRSFTDDKEFGEDDDPGAHEEWGSLVVMRWAAQAAIVRWLLARSCTMSR